MNKLYVKNELTFSIVWIVVYCVLQSLANPLNKAIGIEYSASAVFCILQTIILLTFILKKTCGNGMAFANRPFLHSGISTMYR